MQALLSLRGVETTISDQCEYGLTTIGPTGEPVLAKKPTQWASNSSFIVRRLQRRCKGGHSHQHLEGGRASKAEIYPLELVLEILRDIRDQCDGLAREDDPDLAAVNVASLLHSGFNADKHGRPLVINSVRYAFAIQDATLKVNKFTCPVKYMDGGTGTISFQNNIKHEYRDEYTGKIIPPCLGTRGHYE